MIKKLLAVFLFALFLSAVAQAEEMEIQPPPFPTTAQIDAVKERMSFQYGVSYRLGFLKLFKPARVDLKIQEGLFAATADSAQQPVYIVDLSVLPRKEKKRGWFSSQFKAVISTSDFHVIYYFKRVREHLPLIRQKSKKNYAEEAFFEGDIAHVHRHDYLKNEVTRKDVNLAELFPNSGSHLNRGEDLPVLVARALLQEGVFAHIQQAKEPIVAQMITQTRAYEFKLQTESDQIQSPLTGKVQAMKVETDVLFRSRDNEIVPFSVWFSPPEALPAGLRASTDESGLYCFPTALKLDFTIGALRVEAESFTGQKMAHFNKP